MQRFNGVSGVILAGGLGTRLRSVIPDHPKVLAPIHGRPFITILLDQLRAVGINRIILCTGYKARIVRDRIGEKYKNVNILYSEESQPLGTGGAIKLAQEKISSEIFVVMNGDSYVNAKLSRFFNWFESSRHTAAIFLTKVDNIKRYGHVVTSKNGKIKKFIEKESSSGPGWINAGVYLLNKKLFKLMPETESFSLEKDFFPSLIGRDLFGYLHETEFIDIGIPKSFFQAEKFFSSLSFVFKANAHKTQCRNINVNYNSQKATYDN